MYGKSYRIPVRSVVSAALVVALQIVVSLAVVVFWLMPDARAQPVAVVDGVARALYPVASSGNVSTLQGLRADLANFARLSYQVGAIGSISTSAKALVPVPGGSSIAVDVVGTIPKARAAAAIGKFMAKGVPILSTGVALYDLGKELGFSLHPDASGQVIVEKEKYQCPNGSCYEYQSRLGFSNSPWLPSPAAAAQWQRAVTAAANPSLVVTVTAIPNCSPGCAGGAEYQLLVNGSFYAAPNVQHRVGSAVQTFDPSTQQEMLDKIDSTTSWPSISAIARTVVDVIKSGEGIQVDPQTVTGPASSPGVSTTTHDSVNNTTTTSTTTNNYTYDGPNITTTQVTNNVTTDNSTNTVTNNTSTTTAPTSPASDDTDPCLSNPDRIGCMEAGTPDQSGKLTPQSIAIALTPVAFTSSATCPADLTIPFTIMGRNMSPHISYSGICSTLNDYIKPILLLLATAAAAYIFVGGLKSGG